MAGRSFRVLLRSSRMFENPDTLAELTRLARKQLRGRARSVRAAYPEAALLERSRLIVERVVALPEFDAAESIALFWPLPREVDLREIDKAARSHGKRVYYPVMDRHATGVRTGMALSAETAELAERGSRFAEPPPSAPRAERGDIDLVFVPALAVALNGHRLGYGAGFYDATLPDFCPPAKSVVVAYDFQLLAELPHLAHDVACDWIVTDRRLEAAVASG